MLMSHVTNKNIVVLNTEMLVHVTLNTVPTMKKILSLP